MERGVLVYVKESDGKTRVGVKPEGQKTAVFFDVPIPISIRKGSPVLYDREKAQLVALPRTSPTDGAGPEAAGKPDEEATRNARISRAVALKEAVALHAALVDKLGVEGVEDAVLATAERFLSWLEREEPC